MQFFLCDHEDLKLIANEPIAAFLKMSVITYIKINSDLDLK